MNTITRRLLALTAVVLLAAAPALSRAERAARPVADYTVFVDPPTGFVFVKLPQGWQFVGRLDAAHVDKLPASVVTALLADDDDNEGSPRLAVHQKR